jgi:hypothetical protein
MVDGSATSGPASPGSDRSARRRSSNSRGSLEPPRRTADGRCRTRPRPDGQGSLLSVARMPYSLAQSRFSARQRADLARRRPCRWPACALFGTLAHRRTSRRGAHVSAIGPEHCPHFRSTRRWVTELVVDPDRLRAGSAAIAQPPTCGGTIAAGPLAEGGGDTIGHIGLSRRSVTPRACYSRCRGFTFCHSSRSGPTGARSAASHRPSGSHDPWPAQMRLPKKRAACPGRARGCRPLRPRSHRGRCGRPAHAGRPVDDLVDLPPLGLFRKLRFGAGRQLPVDVRGG